MNNDVKQRILSESMQLMFNHGIKVMTMDELAKRIGVSKRTIYEHFEDKDALLSEVLKYHIKQKETQSKKSLEKSPTVIHAFFDFFTNVESSALSKAISRYDEIKRYHPIVYSKIIRDNDSQEIENTKYLLNLGIKQGVFRKDLNIDIIAQLLQTFFHQILNEENGLRELFPLEKIFGTFMQIFIRGCSTEKGLKVVETLTEKSKG
ncbi:MAG: TetR/AcrR family transcriptional regulator [Bacteroidales bacterium]|jgi:AcrR family transcriptional regulator|nr:TetR/AcrR family transcriptional regulator [Bacteroidales bacterium]